jgi:hypothetical protein
LQGPADLIQSLQQALFGKLPDFKRVLLEVAEEYDCFLITFEINKGTVTFSFDSDELTAEILTILQHDDKS